ncbi:MAG: type II toxin-antitoxin system Phd/YefM family antitoxin [Actinomycetota bacterium]|nr:type II toxin-antitoxin system Phd/YefM family antitoxin [Actinomycetota bacterium]
MGMEAREFVPLTEARVRFYELIRHVGERTVLLLRHGKPAAVLLSYSRYESLLETIEDLKDKIAIFEDEHEHDDMSVPWEKVKAEAGLLGSD